MIFPKDMSVQAFDDALKLNNCRNPSFGLATKARGCKVAGVKRKEAREQRQRQRLWKGAGQGEARESSHTPGSLRKCEGV